MKANGQLINIKVRMFKCVDKIKINQCQVSILFEQNVFWGNTGLHKYLSYSLDSLAPYNFFLFHKMIIHHKSKI